MISEHFSLIPFKLCFRVKICVYSYRNSCKVSPYAELWNVYSNTAISAFYTKQLNEMISKHFSLIPFKLCFRVKICVYSYRNSCEVSPYAELC